jgi:thiosulfate/3-mercaptopyruvate sulfurtransferase
MEIERDELAARLGDATLAIVDVRTPGEYDGTRGNACDPRHGHIPGARNLDVAAIVQCASLEEVHALVGLPPGAEIAAYCHSGSRSAVAAQVLRAAGYDARNYAGSWHEWSRHDALPFET